MCRKNGLQHLHGRNDCGYLALLFSIVFYCVQQNISLVVLLSTGAGALKDTDICDHALDVLSSAGAGLRRVVILGRRGHVQASFTIKVKHTSFRSYDGRNSFHGASGSCLLSEVCRLAEACLSAYLSNVFRWCCITHFCCPYQELRELTKLDGVACLVRQQELEQSRTPESLEELKTTRAKNRIDSLLNKVRRQLRTLPDKIIL